MTPPTEGDDLMYRFAFDACPKAPGDETPIHCEHWYGFDPCCWCGDNTTLYPGHHPTEVEA